LRGVSVEDIDESTHTRKCAEALINFTGSSFYKGDNEDVKSPSEGIVVNGGHNFFCSRCFAFW